MAASMPQRSSHSGKSIRGRAGWSTTQPKSGLLKSEWPSKRSRRPELAPIVWLPSASPISGKPRFSGSVRPACRSTTRSCGRTGAQRNFATACARTATRSCCAGRPDWSAMPISQAAKSAGCSITSRERASGGELAFGTVDSWLVWNLTAGARHITDATNAARTMLFNIETQQWDQELLELFEIPRAILPEVVGSSEVCATATGLLEGVPVAGIAGDQQAALFGQMCVEAGMVKCTYGTGAFLLLATGEKPVWSQNRLLTTIACRIGHQTTYALEGSVFIAGAAVQWLRDELQIIRHAAEVESLAASVPDAAGVYVVPAFSGLGAPHWDPYARGAILGLTRGANRAHIARAALEGIAFQVADVVQAMEQDAGAPLKELRVDGGAACNNLLMQMQADLLGVTVTRPANLETTVLGATYLAGLAVGYWPDQATIAKQWQAERRFTPAMSEAERQGRRKGWQRALERVRGWESV